MIEQLLKEWIISALWGIAIASLSIIVADFFNLYEVGAVPLFFFFVFVLWLISGWEGKRDADNQRMDD